MHVLVWSLIVAVVANGTKSKYVAKAKESCKACFYDKVCDNSKCNGIVKERVVVKSRKSKDSDKDAKCNTCGLKECECSFKSHFADVVCKYDEGEPQWPPELCPTLTKDGKIKYPLPPAPDSLASPDLTKADNVKSAKIQRYLRSSRRVRGSNIKHGSLDFYSGK